MAFYPTDGVITHEIPRTSIKGRSDFIGWINTRTNRIRIDCISDPVFWLEIDLSFLKDSNDTDDPNSSNDSSDHNDSSNHNSYRDHNSSNDSDCSNNSDSQ
jgi:hypothetical protein